MTLKAACLWNAQVIDARQKKIVEQRARKFSQNDKTLGRPAYNIKTPDAAFILNLTSVEHVM